MLLCVHLTSLFARVVGARQLPDFHMIPTDMYILLTPFLVSKWSQIELRLLAFIGGERYKNL